MKTLTPPSRDIHARLRSARWMSIPICTEASDEIWKLRRQRSILLAMAVDGYHARYSPPGETRAAAEATIRAAIGMEASE